MLSKKVDEKKLTLKAGFWTARHISTVNSTEITKNKPGLAGQPAYDFLNTKQILSYLI